MFKLNAMEGENTGPMERARAAVERGEDEVQVLAGDAGSASEVMRFLEGRGYRVQLQDDDGRLTLNGTRAVPPPASAGPSFTRAVGPLPMEKGKAEARAQPPQFERPPVERPRRPIETAPVPLTPLPKDVKGLTLLIMGRTMGRGDPELGELLMKSFLAALARSETPPEALVLLNEGVRLALFDTSTCDHLKDLEARGTRVLVSSVCAGHLGITGDVGVGILSSMVDILDALNRATRPLVF